MKANQNFIFSGILTAFFLIFTFLVLKVDVRPIGPDNSVIGLATINGFFRDLIGVNFLWYYITDWLGLAALLIPIGFAILGFFQLIKRKSFLKVDTDILILGGLYLLIIAVYCFFEIKPVNFRPVLMDGKLEASFPSSHIMIVCTIVGSAMMQFIKRVKSKKLLEIINIIAAAIIVLTVFGRLISGVHWISDIIGGLLLSGALLMLYHSCVSLITLSSIN